MRRNVLALGIFLMFLAFILQASSQMAVEIDPARDTWANVNSNEANPPILELSVAANLSKDDKFRVFFSLQKSTQNYVPDGLGIKMNLTDPNGDVISFERNVEIDENGKVMIIDPTVPYPTVLANYTGTYTVDAESRGVVLIRLLTIQKYEIIEARIDHPWAILSPASVVVFFTGAFLLVFGALSSKGKKLRKSRLSKASLR